MAGPMDIFGVELEDLKDVYQDEMVPYLDHDSVLGKIGNKSAELMNPALNQAFQVLSMDKIKNSLPSMEQLDETFKDGSLLEKFTAQAQSLPRAGIDVMNWLFSDQARVFKTRQQKLDNGMEMRDILDEEPLMDSVLAVLGPVDFLGGLAVPGVKKLSNKFGTAILPLMSQKIKEAEAAVDPDHLGDSIESALDDLGVDYTDEDEIELMSAPISNAPNTPPPGLAYGGNPEEEIITESVEEQSDIPTINSDIPDDIFQAAKDEGYDEVDVAGLFGKVPMWAMANVDKAKMLMQIFTKNEKKNMDNIKNKLGTKEEVAEKIEDIDILDTPSGETVVGTVKNKKTIIDSPEEAESAFYSGLEARLMDPNTPKSFSTKEDLFNFLNQKGISKVEVEDNILNRYVDIAEKNGKPLLVDDMLDIVRQAPMRKVQSVVYGDARYGGTKAAKYNGYQESGALPGSYREEVLYLPAEDIPLDPGNLPMSGHDFAEKYVIGWSRLTDRKATLPVDKTAQGIAEQVDPAMIRTLKRNQKTLDRQLKGLEVSALRKLNREFPDVFGDVDSLTGAEVRNVLDQGDTMARLRSVDEPLEQQILQFRMKIDSDAAKLQKMEASTKGQPVTVTFADEVQSDILQQAKKMEEKFTEQLADLMDANTALRSAQIRSGGYKYGDITPEVADYFLKNKTVFRPIFQTAQEMQGFLDEFSKGEEVFKELSEAGLQPSKDLLQRVSAAKKKEKELLSTLEKSLSEESMKKLMPNVPFKNRSEWGSALLKMNVNNAAKRLFVDKADDAAEWFAISPSKLITKRYGQSGGTNVPPAERTKDMKGIGMEEFYGGPTSTDYKGKHYTSVLEKEMKRLAKENNSEFKIIKIDNVGDAFAVKLTPEMLLPHKTHRNKGGMVYTPELINIFEAA
tara:strand:- start:225 stop:2942 length:2718 start_codon:yes stop_codon:yes gene_type:complete